MILNIKVIPKAKANCIQKLNANSLKVRLAAPPVNGRANKELIETLSEYYKVKRGQIAIMRGERSQNKIIKIMTNDKAQNPK